MLKSKDALTLTIGSVTLKPRIVNIFTQIMAAACEGFHRVNVSEELSMAEVLYFETLGYHIESTGASNFITWGSEEDVLATGLVWPHKSKN